MARNGSGTYSRAVSSYVYNTVIDQVAVNAEMDDIATALTASLAKDGQTVPTANLPMGGYKHTGLGAGSAAGNSLRYEQLFTTGAVQLLGAMDWVKGADIASATTINLTTATGNGVHVTGTTQIDAVTLGTGMLRLVVFDGILTLAHHTTNNNLPGGANITTAAGDRAIYWADGTTVYCVVYMPSAGYQGKDAELTALAGLTSAANKVPMFSGSGTATLLDFKDEDNMASDSATAVPSQQSTKAYVDAQILTRSTITLGTPQATTSGSSIDYTSIPTGTKRITMMFSGVSTNGTANPKVQIGDAGGLETSTYLSYSSHSSGTATVTSTAGFVLYSESATDVITGTIVLTKENSASNTWIASGTLFVNSTNLIIVAGVKSLSAELDRISFVTTDTFDAGEINISYE